MLKKVGCTNAKITDNITEISEADKLILPGVGSFDHGMQQLHEKGLVSGLNKLVIEEKKPVLGICLGAQLLCKKSEEGKELGLGWVNAEVKKFDVASQGLKVPHMAWNEVKAKHAHPIIDQLPVPARFYFVHSYYIQCLNTDDELLTAQYGHPFCAAIQFENVIGMQFHPEKSHKFGMQVFKNFAAL